MVIILDNGQTVTIYENNNLLKQIEPYIDKEIYDLLEDKFGFIQKPSHKINVVKYGDELIGQTIKYCEVTHNGDIDHNVIATEEGTILMFDINNCDDEYANLKTYNQEAFNRVITNYKYIRDELLQNDIISKEYVDKLLEEEKQKQDEKKAKEKEQKYQEYLKLKKEFEE